MSDPLQQLCDQVRAAAAAGRRLRIRAGGSKDFYGNTPAGELLDPRVHAGIVAYEPSELVVTARCGTPLAELEATLAECGQMLAFEPPDHAGRATVGGCIAAGLAGPGRMAAGYRFGGVRESVLGVQVVDGRGQRLRFGGTVLKNVAGYDISRLLAGSLGALALIAEVSLKVIPLPFEECTLRFEADEATALRLLGAWRGRPLPITATSWREGQLCVRLGGAASALQAARTQLGGSVLADATARGFWASLRHQTHPYFRSSPPLWRVSLPPRAPALALGGRQWIEWQGQQRWLAGECAASEVRARAAALGGHATLFRRGTAVDGSLAGGAGGVFAPLPPALLALHRRLRTAFDPHGVFDFGRLVTEG